MRRYIVFGSNDGAQWVQLGIVEASGHTQAMGQFRDRTTYAHYGSCPLRNWASATPQIKERAPVITWEPIRHDDGQLTVEDVAREKAAAPAEAAKRYREELAEERTP
jgi:hypothetical protein